MRLLMVLALLATGCGDLDTGGNSDAAVGAPPVLVQMSEGRTELGVPLCAFGLNSTRACPAGERNRDWLRYQDGSGFGCLAESASSHYINEEGPTQRWGAYEFCAAGSVESVAPGCACEDDARCPIPAPPLSESAQVIVYTARDDAMLPNWARVGGVLVTQRVGLDHGAAVCMSGGSYPMAMVRFDPVTWDVVERECYEPESGEPIGCAWVDAMIHTLRR